LFELNAAHCSRTTYHYLYKWWRAPYPYNRNYNILYYFARPAAALAAVTNTIISYVQRCYIILFRCFITIYNMKKGKETRTYPVCTQLDVCQYTRSRRCSRQVAIVRSRFEKNSWENRDHSPLQQQQITIIGRGPMYRSSTGSTDTV